MARTFPADFAALQTSKSASPYYIFECQWGGATGTKFYLDRLSTDFQAAGTRVPGSGIGTSKVLRWPAIGLSLKEGQVGSTDQLSIELEDAAGEITAILDLEAKQRKTVKIWRLFDDATVTWSGDAALMMVGSLRPFDYEQAGNTITLNIVDASGTLTKDVSLIATRTAFTRVPQESRDRNIPLVWGLGRRVEGVLVDRPWETKILQGVDGSQSQTVTIDDHPDDLGITSGVSINAWLGESPVTATFNQSPTPDTVLSTVTIASTANQVIANCMAMYAFNTGNDRFVVVPFKAVWPMWYADLLAVMFPSAASVMVFLSDSTLSPSTTPPYGWNTTTLSVLEAHSPWPDHYRMGFSDANVNAKVLSGAVIKFLSGTTYRPPYPPGTILRERDKSKYVYAVNALPSKEVIKVEGWGNAQDDAGQTRKDFIPCGALIGDLEIGGT